MVTKKKAAKQQPKKIKPTIEQFSKYQAAYDWFNRKLFSGVLSPCLLVFRDGKKKKGLIELGYFAWDRWQRGDGTTCHEISLNPQTLNKPLAETMATLVHEMAHQWQQDHGTPPRPGYHDREWVAKMIEVGLIPSHTGEPNGKQTGQRMHHYPDPQGKFLVAFKAMPETILLPWISGEQVAIDPEKEKESNAKNKIKYSCPCGFNVWGKPDLNIICGECEEQFSPDEPEPDESDE